MIIACNQPYFAPFPGFFYKILRADIFVLLDSVQFPRGTTWVSRNRFKNDQGTLWLTIPVKKKGLGLQRIDQVKIHHDGRWEKKHVQSLVTAYKHAPYISEHAEWLEGLFYREYLVDVNIEIIRYVTAYLGIHTKLVLLSELGITAKGTGLLIDLCQHYATDQLLVQKPAAKYLNEELFVRAGINLHYIRYPVPVYPQLWGDFLPNLSTLDMIFNCGPRSLQVLLNAC